MSDAAVRQFFSRLQEDRELAREYRSTLNQALESAAGPAILDVAARNGVTFSVDELRSYLDQRSSELDDEQLDGVAGGQPWPVSPFLSNPWFIAAAITTAIPIPLALGDRDDAS